ncbi:MAG: tetratricopeptide repeat protein [Bryobacteraceae bacterium]
MKTFPAAILAPLLIWAQAGDPAALSGAAAQLAGEKRFAEAEELWRRALNLAPGFVPALFNLGYMHFSQQEFAKAEPLLARAAQANPEDFNTRFVLGATLLKLNRRIDALRQWRAALARNPGNVKLMQILCIEYSKGRYFREAAEIAAQALRLRPEDANLYFLGIKAYQDSGDDEAAFDLAAKAAAKFPDSGRANFEYAFQLQKLQRVEESLPFLKKAMAAEPFYEEPFFHYGELLMRQNRSQEAIPYLRAAIKNRPDYIAARMALAKALLNSRKEREAIAEVEAAIGIDAKSPQPHLLLSQIYFRLGDEERAREAKERSLRLRRENPALLEAVQGRPFPEER